MEWISVNSILPEHGELVLVAGIMESGDKPIVSVGMLSNNAENNYYDNTQPIQLWETWERVQYDHMMLGIPKVITHWMPLPEQPGNKCRKA